ncbi:MAG: hypothetical protein LBK26_01330 [Rickettsiales bacterium]|nr:hypothetical protein [Rickettsiales bacterium]
MPESIDDILKRLRTKLNGPAPARLDAGAQPLPDFIPHAELNDDDANARAAIQLSPDKIISPVHMITPAQVSHVAELFANNVANALNMRAFAPRIRQIAEMALRKALGNAKKMGIKK